MHYPQYEALDAAVRFYRRKDVDYNERKLGLLAARMLAANEVLVEQTGAAHLAPGAIDMLITIFQQYVPHKEGQDEQEEDQDRGQPQSRPRRLRRARSEE